MTEGAADIRAAISDQLGRFARLLDTRQWDGLDTVFAGDVRFDYGEGRTGSGLAALRAMFRRYLDRCGPSQHLLGSPIIDLGDPAMPVSACYVQARHVGTGDGAANWFDTSGEYRDSWRRDGNIWRIVRRTADFRLFVGDPGVIAFDG
ncbi:MAG: nuclear transport factor 2 family protein [Sphingobium sp.]